MSGRLLAGEFRALGSKPGLWRFGCAFIVWAMPLIVVNLVQAEQPLYAQQLDAAKVEFPKLPCAASSDEILLIEQVEQLRQSKAYREAANAVLERLDHLDAIPSEQLPVVAAGDPQVASTLTMKRYVPVDVVFSQSLQRCWSEGAQAVATLEGQLQRRSAAEFDAQRSEAEASRLRSMVARFGGLPDGYRHHLLASDFALELGQPLLAMNYLDRITPEMRFDLAEQGGSAVGQAAGDKSDWRPIQTLHRHVFERLVAEVGSEQVDLLEAVATQRRVALERIADGLSEQVDYRLSRCRSAVDKIDASAKPPVPSMDLLWPDRSGQLRAFWSTGDSTPASRPRMGENGAACLPYFPRRIGEGVWVNEITRICRYSLQGAVAEESQLVAFDAMVTPDSLADAKYPIAGAPRGDLALAPPFLYARVGGLVSSQMDDDVLAGRLPRAEIVALDISKPSDPRVLFEARCQELGVSGAAPERLEFEGPPVVFGDLLLVPVVERMNVGVSRMVIGLDRYSGQLRWQSQVLGQGGVPGTERASHIGFQQLCVAGGMLFYATNLGTVCCLNPGDGSVQWVVQYVSPSMFMPGSGDDGRPLRFLYRQVNCQCNAGLLYCAPSDCGEVFALDATSGDLVWSTAAGEVPDIKTFVGFAEDSIVYSGDRLVWLDRWAGSVQSVFPGARTPGRLMALHRSRGVGQPALHQGYVYFPTSEEILVFDASQSPAKLTQAQQGEQASASRVGESPARVAEPISRMATGSRGAAGGNLLVDDEVLLMATPSRLHIFRRD